jgi:hypothetical protein
MCIALPVACLFADQAKAGDLNEIFARMEPGSIIKNLLIPRYDREKKPSMILRADRMVVKTLKSFTAENVSLHLIHSGSNRTLRQSWFAMDSCRYDLNDGSLRSDTELEAISAQFHIRSQGLITTLVQDQREYRAFLLPPVTGYLNPNPDESIAMKRTRQSLLLASILTAQAAAQEPPVATPAASESFFAMSPRSQEIDARLQEFAKKNGVSISLVPLPDQPTVALPEVSPVPPMPKFVPALDALGFACKGGVFYDSKTASLTLLKDVTVRNPEYAMTVKGEVKIFFEEETAKVKPTEKPSETPDQESAKDPKKPSNTVGKIQRLHGTGGVAFEAQDQDGVKNFAAGDEVIYEMAKEEFYLRGSKLIFQQGAQSRFESASPDAWLRFNKKTKNFTMSEGWNARLAVPADKQP